METSEIFELLDKFDKSSLSEVIINRGDVKVTLRKPSAHFVVSQGAPLPVQAVVPPHHAAGQPQPTIADEGDVITSPIVGTFYRSASPDSPPFVEQDSRVAKGQTLCILEAMKVMNELEAEFDCIILDVLVENGKMVEFGTPLFKVKRA